MSNELKAFLDNRALSMMSNTYFFELTKPIHPFLKTIGNARVTAVIINESSPPELLIHPEGEEPSFHGIDQVSFSSALTIAV